MIQVMLNDYEIALVNSAGKIYALSDMCSHAYCYIHYGWVEDNKIICPCHGAPFDPETGASLGWLLNSPLRTYQVKIEGPDIFVLEPEPPAKA